MKKTDVAGSQMTTNQDENTGIKLLNCFSEKVTSQVIDAERHLTRLRKSTRAGLIIDCDTLQAKNDYSMRYGCIGEAQSKIIEV